MLWNLNFTFFKEGIGFYLTIFAAQRRKKIYLLANPRILILSKI